MELLEKGFLWYAVFLFSTILHEAAHAFAAFKLGDTTAYEGGQVSLNPIPHIRREIVGTVVVPIVSFFMSGWMIGWASTPYDPRWALAYPRRSALMALAGPLSNLLLVLVSVAVIRAGLAHGVFEAPFKLTFSHVVEATSEGFTPFLCTLLSVFFSLNLLLCVFNLMPLPPLDGSGIIPLVLGDNGARRYMEFIRHPSFAFWGLFAAWKLFDLIFHPIHLQVINLLYPGVEYR